MALSQSALSELLEAFRTGGRGDMVRESVRTVLQELADFEAASGIGAERYERTEDHLKAHHHAGRTVPRERARRNPSVVSTLFAADRKGLRGFI